VVNFPDSFVAVAASGVGDSSVDDFESAREASDTDTDEGSFSAATG
jgi:hypothetical protein